ncbi:MAG TPA: hypothetical protein VFL84_12525 [Gammaproteobacteria bacterium]|nr:hypothetical protein [Gammaproteobacteria bacterium]
MSRAILAALAGVFLCGAVQAQTYEPIAHWLVLLSGMGVAPNGDLYVTDAYSSDYVHRFDAKGK